MNREEIRSDEPPTDASASASPAADVWPRLPEWNDLTNEQRREICAEGEYWCEDFGRDAACGIYRRIRETVLVPPPPLLALAVIQSGAQS